MFRRLRTPLLLVLLTGLAACNARDETKAPPAPVATHPAPQATEHDKAVAAEPAKAEPKGAEPTKAEPTKAGADVDAGSCSALVAGVCKKLGDKHDVCGAFKVLEEVLEPAACDASSVDKIVARAGAARKVCDELVTKLCNDIGPDTDTCAMVKRETEKFPIARCQQMTGEYAAVLESLKKMEARNKPLSPEVMAKQTAGEGPSFGPADAKVVLIEYSDFQCPYCGRAAKVTHQLKEKYGDKVRLVFHQFPLGFHKNAMLAAEAALEAHAQGKFWELHDLLFENQKALGREDLDKYAAQIGLDLAAFKAALDGHTHKAAIEADQKLGAEVGVDGTPTLFLQGKRVQNPSDFAALSKEIDAALGH